MITKGIRISQLVERKDLNGKEIIPFQDGIHNGKLSIQSLIDYIVDISDSDLELQALIKIQKFVDTVSEMDLLLYQAKEGDIYYCKENKKLYVRSFNKWDMLDPLTSKVYVLVGLDEYNRTNIIHLWDGNDMVVTSERLFIGEVTGTAYDGGKGKHLADIANSLPDNVIREVADFTTDGSTVTFNYEYDVKQESGLFDGDAQGSKTIPSATTSNAGVMSATDKVKVDKIVTDGDGNKYLTDNGTYKEVSGGGGSGEQYYKINNDKFLPYLRTPAYYKDTDAETAITYVFNTVDKFKEFIDNALDNGYVLELINRTNNEKMYIRDYHVYRSSNGNYELSFIFIYSENNGSDNFALVTTRVFMSYNASNGYKFIVNNLVQSDNLTTVTKKTKSEYDGISTKDNSTMYAITE